MKVSFRYLASHHDDFWKCKHFVWNSVCDAIEQKTKWYTRTYWSQPEVWSVMAGNSPISDQPRLVNICRRCWNIQKNGSLISTRWRARQLQYLVPRMIITTGTHLVLKFQSQYTSNFVCAYQQNSNHKKTETYSPLPQTIAT